MKRIAQFVIVLLTAQASALLLGQAKTEIDSRDRSPHREGFVTADGVRLHYLDWGGMGPNLVWLTGFGNSAHDSDRLAEHFSSRFRVIAMTRRGRSPSEEPTGSDDLPRLTADVKAVLDALSVDRFHVAGHSMAGTEMEHDE